MLSVELFNCIVVEFAENFLFLSTIIILFILLMFLCFYLSHYLQFQMPQTFKIYFRFKALSQALGTS